MKFWLGFLMATLLWMGVGCLLPRRQQRMEREWESIWEGWQIESKDDCDYIDNFNKHDCMQRHNVHL